MRITVPVKQLFYFQAIGLIRCNESLLWTQTIKRPTYDFIHDKHTSHVKKEHEILRSEQNIKENSRLFLVPTDQSPVVDRTRCHLYAAKHNKSFNHLRELERWNENNCRVSIFKNNHCYHKIDPQLLLTLGSKYLFATKHKHVFWNETLKSFMPFSFYINDPIRKSCHRIRKENYSEYFDFLINSVF